MNRSNKIIITLAILIALIRPFMPQRHGFTTAMTYEAIAHVIVGMLVAGWMLSDKKKSYWIALVIITAIEVFCALRP